MTSHRSFRTIAGVAAFALATAFGVQAASAQPAGGPHGHHGMAGPDEMIGHLIASAKSQLNLNTSQQTMFDTAVADSKAAFQSGRALHQKVRDTLNAELAKTEPDLAAVAAAGDAAMDQGRAQRKAIRDRVARALRHVHAGPEGRREGHAAEATREERFDQGEDARALQGLARCGGIDRTATSPICGWKEPGFAPGSFIFRRRRDRPAWRHAFRWPLPRRS